MSAYHAMSQIEDGMYVGLGTGSTAAWLVKLLGARREIEGLDITAVSTSEATEALAREMNITTAALDDVDFLDVTIDGADEFDGRLNLVKGGGGALLREKIVASASRRMVVITDESKKVDVLGAFPLPVEVVKFAWKTTQAAIAEILEDSDVSQTRIVPRLRDGDLFVTDEGHHILDLHLEEIGDPEMLAQDLVAVPGVVETGLFIDMADAVYIGVETGEARILTADREPRIERLEEPDRLERFLSHLD